MVSFLVDAALAVMLVTATVYLVIVNKRLKLLRSGQSEINTLIAGFSKSVDDTDASMKRLVGSATETAGQLADELDRAKGTKEEMARIKEEMTLLLGSCERTVTRMEESVHQVRALLRRLDEGAMRPAAARPRPEAVPEPAAEPVAAVSPAPAAAPAPVATILPVLEADDAGETTDGVRPRQRPIATVPAPSAEGEAPRPAAVGAFYARLRTVGSEG